MAGQTISPGVRPADRARVCRGPPPRPVSRDRAPGPSSLVALASPERRGIRSDPEPSGLVPSGRGGAFQGGKDASFKTSMLESESAKLPLDPRESRRTLDAIPLAALPSEGFEVNAARRTRRDCPATRLRRRLSARIRRRSSPFPRLARSFGGPRPHPEPARTLVSLGLPARRPDRSPRSFSRTGQIAVALPPIDVGSRD